MKIKLILNPNAGRKKAKKVIPVIKEIFRNRKLSLDIDITGQPGEGIQLSREAVRNNFDMIIAAGGDGTVNEVVNGMIGSNSTLGVIPLGLGNDFAKANNIPYNLDKACRVLYDGVQKYIDVGRINERYFVNSLGIGFDAYVARERQRIKWFFYTNWIYLYAVIKMLFRYKAASLKINFADVTVNKKVLLIAIGNGKTSGGGFLLTPDAELDDGLLDICIIDDVERLRLLMHLPRALKGTHTKLPYVTTLKTKKLTIHSEDLLLAHADGEILESNHYRVEILPKRLRVMTPQQE